MKIHRNFDYYYGRCPNCQNNICCFCSKVIDKRLLFNRYIEKFCCFKRTFFLYFLRENYENSHYPLINFILGYIAFIIPLFSSWGLFFCIINNLFSNREIGHEICIIRHLVDNNCCLSSFIIFLIFGFSFCMPICFPMFSIFYILIVFIFSIPFKFKPLTNLIFYIAENISKQI